MKTLRRILDFLMTSLSLVLMGGVFLFSDTRIHEILGTVLIALWIFHNILNRNWYKSLFRGKYNGFRICMTVINALVILSAVLLFISGIILSNHVFRFLGIDFGLGFARVSHLIVSHWYFIFIALHFALHSAVIFGAVQKKLPAVALKAVNVILFLYGIYGIFAFFLRGFHKYLFAIQQFFFFDLERGIFFFIFDYMAIFVLFAGLFNILRSKFSAS